MQMGSSRLNMHAPNAPMATAQMEVIRSISISRSESLSSHGSSGMEGGLARPKVPMLFTTLALEPGEPWWRGFWLLRGSLPDLPNLMLAGPLNAAKAPNVGLLH
uniref:Uncharacterized protein n=1 Tax=Pyrodinium bahamense TaxID=73915 RepID=A0A7R9ZYU5_9DINO